MLEKQNGKSCQPIYYNFPLLAGMVFIIIGRYGLYRYWQVWSLSLLAGMVFIFSGRYGLYH